MFVICDIIKGNESYVQNTDFEMQTKRGDKILRFYIVLNVKELFIFLQPDVRLRWGLERNIAFQMEKWFMLKIKIEYCWHVTHSPWSCHIYHSATIFARYIVRHCAFWKVPYKCWLIIETLHFLCLNKCKVRRWRTWPPMTAEQPF